MHLSAYLCHVSCRRYRPLKFQLSCEIVEKMVFWAPDLYGDVITQILNMRFQIALTSDHVAGYG